MYINILAVDTIALMMIPCTLVVFLRLKYCLRIEELVCNLKLLIRFYLALLELKHKQDPVFDWLNLLVSPFSAVK